MIITRGEHKMSRGMLRLRIQLPSRHVGRFTELRGCAARVVTVNLSIELLRSDGGFQALLAVLQWAERGDSADNIMQAVSDLQDCGRGDRNTLTWMNQLSTLVCCLCNPGIPVDDPLAGAVALRNPGINGDQRTIVAASICCSLWLHDVLLAVPEIFPGTPATVLLAGSGGELVEGERTVDGACLPSATMHDALLLVGGDVHPPGVYPGVCFMVSLTLG